MIALLKWLNRHYHAKDISEVINKHPGLRPRNVTATDDEKAKILRAAPPHIRLWLLLCSDLAIRSGTAARLAPHNYDRKTRLLRFTTKLGEKLTLPVTDEIAALLATCDHERQESYVRQLQRRWQPKGSPPLQDGADPVSTLGRSYRILLRSLGITRKLTPHDFRRTTAVKLYNATHDARDVQSLLGHRSLASTIWYLDHDLHPVSRSMLELLKRPQEAVA